MRGTYRFEEHEICARTMLRYPALNHGDCDLSGLERAWGVEASHRCVVVSER